jgi:hypothetical protein
MNSIANVTTPTPAPVSAPDAAASTPAPPSPAPPVPAPINIKLTLGAVNNFQSFREITTTLTLPLAVGKVDELVEGLDSALAVKLKETSEYKSFESLKAKEQDLGAQLEVAQARLTTASARRSELAITTDAKDLPAVLADAGKAVEDFTRQVSDINAALSAVRQAKGATAPALARKIVQSSQEASTERATAAIEHRDEALAKVAAKIVDDIASAALSKAAWNFAQAPVIARSLAAKLGVSELVDISGQVAPNLQSAPPPPAPVLKSDDTYSDWNRIMGGGKFTPQPPREHRAGDVISIGAR